MKFAFSSAALRFLLLGTLATAGSLATSCTKDSEVAKDYAAIDENLIKEYLAKNSITTALRQPSGLYYLPLTANPSGTRAVAGKTVTVYYTGLFLDGRVFDSSLLHGNTPFSFGLGRGEVIAGWDEGVALMRKGEKAALLIPSALAYGSRGSGSSIPSNTVLRFEIDVTDVK